MGSIVIAIMYLGFIYAHTAIGLPPPDGTYFSAAVGAITALTVRGYYKHLEKARAKENE